MPRGYSGGVSDLEEHVERWLARGERVAVATVVATRRSSPRPVGSKLVVSEGGEIAGSVSGGCVESDVVLAAQEVLGGAPPLLRSYGITDEMALNIGLPCGGEIDVFVEPLADAEERDVTLTVIGGAGIGERLDDPELERAARRRGRSHVIEQGGRKIFAEVHLPAPRLLVYGAVDTAEALCAAARRVGWTTIVADARGRFATRERVPSADELLVAWPEETLEQVRPDESTAIVVLTHDDKFDLPLLRGALATEAFYVGALGSRRNQERRHERLLEEGVSEEDFARIHGPCGLDIGAESPAETALSILAEMLAVRAERAGGSLTQIKNKIPVANA
jgi:xanthine dehydrogenase accessory factor